MGFIVFVISISFLIVNEVRKAIYINTTDNVSEESAEDYFDDFETL